MVLLNFHLWVLLWTMILSWIPKQEGLEPRMCDLPGISAYLNVADARLARPIHDVTMSSPGNARWRFCRNNLEESAAQCDLTWQDALVGWLVIARLGVL